VRQADVYVQKKGINVQIVRDHWGHSA